MRLERPSYPFPKMKELLFKFNTNNFIIAVIAFLSTVTGPLAVLLAIGTELGLSDTDVTSWIFAGYSFGGVISIILCYLYRQPIIILWGMTGTVLLIGVGNHFNFQEIIGAYIVTAFLITVLGITGWIKKVMHFIPMPIIMGMVAGIFLPIVLKMVFAFQDMLFVSIITVITFVLISIIPSVARIFPPILGAIMMGALMIFLGGDFTIQQPISFSIISPTFYVPIFTLNTIIELVIPLTVSVIGVQNAQSIAILKASKFEPPTNVITITSGISTFAMGLFGSTPAATIGPVTAIFNSDGVKETRYLGAIYMGIMCILFGLFAPVTASVAMAFPTAFIGLLGGLALLPVLQNFFVSAFSTNFTLGALIAFLVTISNITIFNISSAFWGLVFGVIISFIMEKKDFSTLRKNLADKVA